MAARRNLPLSPGDPETTLFWPTENRDNSAPGVFGVRINDRPYKFNTNTFQYYDDAESLPKTDIILSNYAALGRNRENVIRRELYINAQPESTTHLTQYITELAEKVLQYSSS